MEAEAKGKGAVKHIRFLNGNKNATDKMNFKLQISGKEYDLEDAVKATLDDLQQIGGIPSNEDFYNEFTFRLGVKLGIKKVITGTMELQEAIQTVNGHFEIDVERLFAKADEGIDKPYILEAVCRYFGVNDEDIRSKRRHEIIVWPRQVAMWLMREFTQDSLTRIGAFMGGKDHATVRHGVIQVNNALELYPFRAKQVKDILSIIEHKRR